MKLGDIMRSFRKVGAIILVALMLLSTIPSTAFATAESQKMSEEFSKILTDGKFIFNYAKPKSKNDLLAEIACSSFEDATGKFGLHDSFGKVALSDDLSEITIGLYKNMECIERHTVDVIWNYSEKAVQAANRFLKKLPPSGAETTYFHLSDLEYMNYLGNTASSRGEFEEMANYSGELKTITENTNFSLKMETRGGGGPRLYDTRIGITRLYHADSVYGVLISEIAVRANHVIYVSENTGDTKEELIAAAQKRVNDYIGKNVIRLTDSGMTVSDYYAEEVAVYDKQISEWEQKIADCKANIDAEKSKAPEFQNQDIINSLTQTINFYESECARQLKFKEAFAKEFQSGYLKEAVGGYIFNVALEGLDKILNFVVVKDNAKLTVPTYINVDVNTDASVSTDSSEVPLDTVIKVEKITHGEEHERICGTLEIKDGEIFDIKLHSGSLDDYITELKSGKFKVRLPIKNEFKGKKLVVYYVDAKGGKTKYNVTVKNNFAFFETDHFSIYTLTTVSDGVQASPNDTSSNLHANSGQQSIMDITTSSDILSSDILSSEITSDDTIISSTTSNNKNQSNNGALIWIICIVIVVFVAGGAVTLIILKRNAK